MKTATFTYRYKKEDDLFSVICLDWKNLVYTSAESIKECYNNAIEATSLAIKSYQSNDLHSSQLPKIKHHFPLGKNEFQITFDMEKARPVFIRIGQWVKYTPKLTRELQLA